MSQNQVIKAQEVDKIQMNYHTTGELTHYSAHSKLEQHAIITARMGENNES